MSGHFSTAGPEIALLNTVSSVYSTNFCLKYFCTGKKILRPIAGRDSTTSEKKNSFLICKPKQKISIRTDPLLLASNGLNRVGASYMTLQLHNYAAQPLIGQYKQYLLQK